MTYSGKPDDLLDGDIVVNADCWEWQRYVTPAGYGQLRRNYKVQYAHRYVYEMLVGPIPDGLTLDHLCRVRSCVNPDHLEPVSSAENTRRGQWRYHCPKCGMYLAVPSNRYTTNKGNWLCKPCMRSYQNTYYGTREA